MEADRHRPDTRRRNNIVLHPGLFLGIPGRNRRKRTDPGTLPDIERIQELSVGRRPRVSRSGQLSGGRRIRPGARLHRTGMRQLLHRRRASPVPMDNGRRLLQQPVRQLGARRQGRDMRPHRRRNHHIPRQNPARRIHRGNSVQSLGARHYVETGEHEQHVPHKAARHPQHRHRHILGRHKPGQDRRAVRNKHPRRHGIRENRGLRRRIHRFHARRSGERRDGDIQMREIPDIHSPIRERRHLHARGRALRQREVIPGFIHDKRMELFRGGMEEGRKGKIHRSHPFKQRTQQLRIHNRRV